MRQTLCKSFNAYKLEVFTLIDNVRDLIDEIDWTMHGEKVRDIVECIKTELAEASKPSHGKQSTQLHCPKCGSDDVSVPVLHNHCLGCGEYFGRAV